MIILEKKKRKKKMPSRPLWWVHFLHWGSLFSYDPGLCQIDKNQNNTKQIECPWRPYNTVALFHGVLFTCSLLRQGSAYFFSLPIAGLLPQSLCWVSTTYCLSFLMQPPNRCVIMVSRHLSAVLCGHMEVSLLDFSCQHQKPQALSLQEVNI